MDISKRLRELMDFRKLTEQQIADVAGVSQASVHKWLNGGGAKGTSTQKIASFYKVNHEWLVGVSDIRTTKDYQSHINDSVRSLRVKLINENASDKVISIFDELAELLEQAGDRNLRAEDTNRKLRKALEVFGSFDDDY